MHVFLSNYIVWMQSSFYVLYKQLVDIDDVDSLKALVFKSKHFVIGGLIIFQYNFCLTGYEGLLLMIVKVRIVMWFQLFHKGVYWALSFSFPTPMIFGLVLRTGFLHLLMMPLLIQLFHLWLWDTWFLFHFTQIEKNLVSDITCRTKNWILETLSMIVSRSWTLDPPHPDLFIDNVPLTSCDSFRILGVTCDKFSFEHHVQYVFSIVTKKLVC